MDPQYLNEDRVSPSHDAIGGTPQEDTLGDHDDDNEPTDEESDGPGRPRHEPTSANRQRVYDGARWGEPQTETAKLLNIDPKTLRKYYGEELKLGVIEANNTVMQIPVHHGHEESKSRRRHFLGENALRSPSRRYSVRHRSRSAGSEIRGRVQTKQALTSGSGRAV